MEPRRATRIGAGTLLAVLALTAPSAAQIYKWVDEKGTVHFSDHVPANAKAEALPAAAPRPTVAKAAPPAESDEEPLGDDEVSDVANDPAPASVEEEQSSEIIVDGTDAVILDDSDTIIVEGSQVDATTRWRANSPRNRPGQPIRQPVRQPRRGR